jgi:hypothetical protein
MFVFRGIGASGPPEKRREWKRSTDGILFTLLHALPEAQSPRDPKTLVGEADACDSLSPRQVLDSWIVAQMQ